MTTPWIRFKCAFCTVRVPLLGFNLKIKAKSDKPSDKMYSLCRAVPSLRLSRCTWACVLCAPKTLLMLLVGRSVVLLNNTLADRQMYRSYCILLRFSSFYAAVVVRIHTCASVCGQREKNDDHVALSPQWQAKCCCRMPFLSHLILPAPIFHIHSRKTSSATLDSTFSLLHWARILNLFFPSFFSISFFSIFLRVLLCFAV